MCVCVLYVMRITQNRNDSINSILEHGRDSISYFRISILIQDQCKWKVATAYLAIRTKHN